MEFVDHFSKQATEYASSRPHYPKAMVSYIANLSSIHQRVLDCATGNGQAATNLSNYFDQVIAFDRSLQQLFQAAPANNIKYLCASANAIPLLNESVDLIVAAQAWHWFDQSLFEQECFRVLRPGGHLAIWGYNLIRINDDMDALIDHFYRQIVGEYWPKERKILEEEYPAFPLRLTAIPAPEFEMQTSWDRDRLFAYFRSWSATQHYIEAKGLDAVKDFEFKMTKLWPIGTVTRIINWSLFLKVAQRVTE